MTAVVSARSVFGYGLSAAWVLAAGAVRFRGTGWVLAFAGDAADEAVVGGVPDGRPGGVGTPFGQGHQAGLK